MGADVSVLHTGVWYIILFKIIKAHLKTHLVFIRKKFFHNTFIWPRSLRSVFINKKFYLQGYLFSYISCDLRLYRDYE